MEQLDKLEAKIRDLLERFEKIRLERDALKAAVGELREANSRLEETLLQKNVRVHEMATDRETTRHAIDALVDSLNALGSTE